MRKRLLLNYLYIYALSILSRSSCFVTHTTDSAVSSSGHKLYSIDEGVVELKQSKERKSSEKHHNTQRPQVIEKQVYDNAHKVSIRRKREVEKMTNSGAPLQGSSHSSGKSKLTSSEQRFKKSDHTMEQDSVKIAHDKNRAKINSLHKIDVPEDQAKRDLRKQQSDRHVRMLSPSTQDKNGQSVQLESKRSSYSDRGLKEINPTSGGVRESDMTARASFAKEKLSSLNNGGYAAIEDDGKARKLETADEQLGDEADLDDNSAEYAESADEDNAETAANYKGNNARVSQIEEASDKLDPSLNYLEENYSDKGELSKRESSVADEEYEDIIDQDGTCEDVNLSEESNYGKVKVQPEVALSEIKGKRDNRVKRYNTEESENIFEKRKTFDPSFSEDSKYPVEGLEHVENVRQGPVYNTKREIVPNAKAAASKYQVDSETARKNEAEETNDSSKSEPRSQEEAQIDDKNKSKLNVRLDREIKVNEDPISNDAKRKIVKRKSDVEDGDNSFQQDSNFDVAAKDDETDSDYAKRVEQQIQQKIESIKGTINREVEQRQRIREIEANNAKYDEMQNEIKEDEDEDNESLFIPNERKNILKRSIIDGIRSPQLKVKRHILKRVKRSDTTNARQLRAIEGVEKLDPDFLTKAKLCHESIHKRSAPIYGAVDADVRDTSMPFRERNDAPRRVYLVNSEQKRSVTPEQHEARNTSITSEQAQAKIENELPAAHSFDANFFKDDASLERNRIKRNPMRFSRRRRANAVVPEGRVAFLGYRAQDDDENDEGSEFDDDGFEDRTSNLQQDNSYSNPHSSYNQYRKNEGRDENSGNFLFSGIKHGRGESLMTSKRAGTHDAQRSTRLRGVAALVRHQTRERDRQKLATPNPTRRDLTDRNKRQAAIVGGDIKSDSVASLVRSSQELSPRLITEYRETFGGLQSDTSGGALARFKRVKRSVRRGP